MPPLSDSDPRRLGSYRLAARLGAGGMGVVYLGYARSGAPVAVKVIHPHLLGDAGVRSRFRREIDAAIRVSSRYTARVLDADPAADPPFLVTEFVAGLTLAAKVAEAGGLDDGAVTGVAVGVAAGIGAIHAAGVVHRDLSPNNVMLTAEGPRIIDLGIAWVDDATTMTQTGGIIGTPAYMAPEVIRGQAVGPMADVFAWGLLTHYAATGTTPFGTGPTQAMLYRIVHDEPDLTGLADPLRGLVAAALSKAPEQRPSAAQLVRRITGSADAGDDRAVDTAVATLVSHTKRLGVSVTSPVNPRPPRPRSRQVAIGAATAVGLAAVVTGSAWIIQARLFQLGRQRQSRRQRLARSHLNCRPAPVHRRGLARRTQPARAFQPMPRRNRQNPARRNQNRSRTCRPSTLTPLSDCVALGPSKRV